MSNHAQTRSLTKLDIELAIAEWFGIRKSIVVPNVSWGLFVHECDILGLSKAGYATEVEIKLTTADLRRDRKKKHAHGSDKIRRLYFAMPDGLKYDEVDVPTDAGILHVTHVGDYIVVIERRACKPNLKARRFTEQERLKLAHLGTMRIWNMKRKLRALAEASPEVKPT